ncbi:hypothetical protein IL306_004320 [Fusarium sp. DS 682]|nr:hypothetical protein IL306_004320 [Fusarium sp. DS 682]
MATQNLPASNTSAQSPWKQAFDSLSPDLKSSLGQATTHKRDILAAVLDAADNRKTISLRKRWKFKRSNGEVVIVRDVIEKIAKWIDRFKTVGDTAVQYDTQRVVAMDYVTVNDVQQYGNMVQDLEVVSRIITRYKEFENLHLGRGQSAEPVLEAALTVLYTEVLKHLAKAISFFSQSTAVRLAKSVFWTGDDGMQSILQREDEVLKLAKLQDTSDLRLIQTTVLRVKDQISSNTKRIDEEDAMKMVCWLSTSPFSIHHDTIAQSRTPGFGRWLLQHEKYKDWCASSSPSTLWIHGITGSGKTHLFSVIVDSLLAERDLDPASTPFAYFYCLNSESEPERSSVDGILRSNLRQLTITESQNDVRDFLHSDFQRRSKSARLQGLDLSRLTRKECVDRIIQVADEDPITILLDDIDQVEDEHCHLLLDCLTQIMSKAGNVVKVLMTSRNSLDVLSLIPSAKELVITADKVQDDMSKFITQKIDEARLVGGRLSSSVRDTLANALLDGAGEMFLWTHRQIQQLRKIKNEGDLLPALESNILSDLDKLYENDLSQILHSGDTSRQVAIQIFSWLLYMKAPLTPEALLAAIVTSSINSTACTAADISSLCSNLVIMDTDHQVVRLAHHSIREYILRAHQSLFSAPAAHSLLASSCIKASSLGPPDDRSLQLQVRDFFFYAAMHWANHFKSSEVVSKEEKLFQEMTSFVFEDEDCEVSLSFEAWLDICKEIASVLPRDHPMKPVLDAIPSDSASPLFLAAIFGIDGLLRILDDSETETDWNQRNSIGHSAVYLAAAFGHLSTVTALIEKGVELDVECGAYGSPLYVACFRGYENIALKLLQHGAAPKYGSKFKSAIHAASHGGHESIMVALIQHHSNITSQEDYEQAVQLATEYGFIQAIDELQKPKFKPFTNKETPDKHKMRVAKAIKGGQLFVLQRQLTKQGAVASEVFPKDAVAIASLYGHRDIVKYLLDQGLDIEVEGQFGTPLRSASLMNHKSIVVELLQSGANFRTGERNGNALYVAAAKGHVDIVRTLLDEGADVRQKTGSFGSTLQAAAYFGHRNVVEVLLDAGAQIHERGTSRDAFHAAAEGGQEEIITLFLQRGYKFCSEPLLPEPQAMIGPRSIYNRIYREASPERVGQRRYPWSGYHGQRDDTGKDATEVQTDWDTTKIETDEHIEAFFGELRKQRRVRLPEDFAGRGGGNRKNRPLEISAANGKEEVIKLLLAQKVGLGISDAQVQTALKAAAMNQHLGAFMILFEYLSASGAVREYLHEVFRNVPELTQEILDYALAKLSRSGCSEDEIDQLRLQLSPSRERHQMAFIDSAKLRSEFLACCRSRSQHRLQVILECKHQQILQMEDLLKGVHIGIRSGNAPFLRLLFHYRPELQGASIPDETLVLAAGEDIETLKFLITLGNNHPLPERLLGKMMHAACTNGHPDIIEFIVLDLEVDINATIPETLNSGDRDSSHNSARLYSYKASQGISNAWCPGNDPERVRFVSPLQVGLSSLGAIYQEYHSQYSGREDRPLSRREMVVQTLLKLGADPNSLGGELDFPLEYAARSCPGQVVEILLEAGADVNLRSEGNSPLLRAAQRELEALSVTQRLLDAVHPQPDYLDEGKKILDILLKFFEVEDEIQAFWGDEHPDGRFQYAPSLEYVFEQGPGAVLEMFLQKFDTGKLGDTRYALVLQMACFIGKRSLVELLLNRGVIVDAVGYHYGCTLQAAARTGQTDIVELLLERGADPNILQGHWQTPLRAACVDGHYEVSRLLLQYHADPKLRFNHEPQTGLSKGRTPVSMLQLALQRGHMAIAKLLLAVEPTLVDEGGYLQHPLIICCQKGSSTMVDLLLEANASVNVQGHKEATAVSIKTRDASPLHASIVLGHLHLVEKLVSKGADVNLKINDCYCQTPLVAAIDSGDMRMVRFLIAAGADISKSADALLPTAIISRENPNIQIVKEVLAAGARVDSPSLQSACKSGKLAIIEALLESLCSSHGSPEGIIDQTLEALTKESTCDPRTLNLLLDYVSPTPERFLFICSSGSRSLVTRMIQQGANVNGSGGDKESPLEAACCHLNLEVVQLLLQEGAVAESRSSKPGETIVGALRACAAPSIEQLEYSLRLGKWYFCPTTLDYRTKQCGADIVRVLLEHGASADGSSGDFENPLQLACLIGELSITDLLLNHGASVSRLTGYFHTPLIAAVVGKNTEILSQILERGVDVNYVHPTFGTALHLACEYEDEALVIELLQGGASTAIENTDGATALTVALQKASRPSFDSHKLPLILCQNSTDLKIIDEDIINAACMWSGTDMLTRLLNVRGEQPVSEDVIIRFLKLGEGSLWHQSLEILLEHSRGLGITPQMLETGPDQDTFEYLTKACKLSCEITPRILERQTDAKTLRALLKLHPGVEITVEVIMRILSLDKDDDRYFDLQFFQSLWSEGSSLQVTQEMLKAAKSSSKLDFLLRRLRPAHGTLQDVALYICENDYHYSVDPTDLLTCVLEFDPKIELSACHIAHLMKKGKTKTKVLDTILTHMPNLVITEELFCSVFGEHPRYGEHRRAEFADIMRRHGKKVFFTKGIRDMIDNAYQEHSDLKKKEVFYSLRERDETQEEAEARPPMNEEESDHQS